MYHNYIKEDYGSKRKFSKFDGDNAFEKYILKKLKESEKYAQFVDNSDAFVSFLAHEISLDDHHGLFQVIGERIGLGKESLMRDVICGLVLFYGEEFEGIRKFIERKII